MNIVEPLVKLYDIMKNKNEIHDFIYEEASINYIIVLDDDGTPLNIKSNYYEKMFGKKTVKMTGQILVPKGVPGKGNAKMLWGNSKYLLGINDTKNEYLPLTKNVIDGISLNTVEINAVKNFYKNFDENYLKLKNTVGYNDYIIDKKSETGNLTFQHKDNILQTVCETNEFKTWYSNCINNINVIMTLINPSYGTCSVTGNTDEIAKLHDKIKGIRGTCSTGGSIVSFNMRSFEFFGKSQGNNCKIGVTTEKKYTSAINKLLKNENHKYHVGDNISYVYWSEVPFNEDVEFFNKLIFENYTTVEEYSQNIETVKNILNSIESGNFPKDVNESTKYYIIEFRGNNGRISIPYFFNGSVLEFSKNVNQYVKDSEYPLYFHNLKTSKNIPCSISRLFKKFEDVKDSIVKDTNMRSELFKAIVSGNELPIAILNSLINIKHSGNIDHERLAMIKAVLNRLKNKKETIGVALDKTSTNVPYLLGRLFATYEKIERSYRSEKNDNKNSIIRPYLKQCSRKPLTMSYVRQRCEDYIKLVKNPSIRTYYEKMIQEISDSIEKYPNIFSIVDSSYFILGYDHQMKDFYTKYEPTTTEETSEDV